MPLLMPPANLCDLDPAGSVEVTGALVINVNTTYTQSLCIMSGGSLTITAGVTLTVGTLHAMPGSTVTAGPTGGITISNTPYYDAAEDQFSTGLILEGVVHIAGHPKTDWTTTTAAIASGATTMTVTAHSGWLVGDHLALGDSRWWRFLTAPVPEEVVITNITGDVITFTPATTHGYPTAKGAFPTYADERFPVVANLTRSFVVQSAVGSTYRGHWMIDMAASGYVRNVQIDRMGRTTSQPINATTNPRGRYAIHLHFLDTFGAFEVSGCAITDSTPSKWGITVHNSSGHLIQDNVVVRSEGTGIMTESGLEADNVFDHNCVIGVTNLTGFGVPGNDGVSPPLHGISGHAYWFEGPRNIVTDNVGCNSSNDGYFIWGQATQGTDNYLHAFSGNEAIACGIGLTHWFLDSALSPAPSIVADFKEWHSVSYGYFGYAETNVQFTNWYGRGDPTALGTDEFFPVGWWHGDYSALHVSLTGVDIKHKVTGLDFPYGNASNGDTTTLRETVVADGVFDHCTRAVRKRTFVGSYPPSSHGRFSSVLRNCVFTNNATNIILTPVYGAGGTVIREDSCYVYDYNGNPSDDFRLYYPEQASTFVLVAGAWEGGEAPYAGQTNAFTWANYSVAFGNAVAPDTTTTRSLITGLLDESLTETSYSVSVATAAYAISAADVSLRYTTAGTTTATFIGLDASTSGGWKTHGYGSLGVLWDENTSTLTSTWPNYWERGGGAVQASGQDAAYGGLFTLDPRASEQYTATNQHGIPLTSGSTTVNPGETWPPGSGATTGFYNRDVAPDAAITFAPHAFRMGFHVTAPCCLRMYFVDMNDGAGITPRVTRVDVYAMTTTPYDDPAAGIGQPYTPGALLDTRTLSAYHSGVYAGWNVTGSVVMEIVVIQPDHFANGDPLIDQHGMAVVSLVLFDPTEGVVAESPIGWMR